MTEGIATHDAATDAPVGFWQRLGRSPVAIAAVAALVTASAPKLIEIGFQFVNGTSQSRAESAEQNALWDRNPTCGQSSPVWRPGRHGAEVDALICDNTGDVLVAAKTPTGNVKKYFVPVEKVAGWGDKDTTLAALTLAGAAYAATALPGERATPLPRGVEVAADVVQCQKRIDDRTIMRHIRTDSGQCFDVYYDTLQGGQEVKRVPVPCRAQC